MPILKIKKGLQVLFFPRKCLVCGKTFAEEQQVRHVCRYCLAELPFRFACEKLEQLEIRAYAPFYYQNPLNSLLLQLKFNGRKEIAPFFAHFMSAVIQKQQLAIDCVTALPLAKQRQKQRGYNQAELLAKAVAKNLGLPYQFDLIKRAKETLQQSSLKTKNDRSANVFEAFTWTQGIQIHKLKDFHILLIDDILTSGASLSAAVNLFSEQQIEVSCLLAASNHV